MRHPTGDQEVVGSTPAEVGNILFVEIDHEIFSMVVLSLPLIQEGQLSVSGERMCTVVVNCFEACPVNVWLGKLTMLYMTPILGWLGCKTSIETNKHLSWSIQHYLDSKSSNTGRLAGCGRLFEPSQSVFCRRAFLLRCLFCTSRFCICTKYCKLKLYDVAIQVNIL